MINPDITMDLNIVVYPKSERKFSINFPLMLKYFLPLLLIVYAFKLKNYRKQEYYLKDVIDDIRNYGYVNDDFDLLTFKHGAIFHDGSTGLLAIWYDSDYVRN